MKTTVIEPHKSSLGMDANIASILVFAAMAIVSWLGFLAWFAWAVPLVFFYLEKESAFVKFQAMQALVIGIASAVINIIFRIFIRMLTPRDIYSALNYAMGRGWGAWRLLGTLSSIVGIAFLALEIFIIYSSYNWKQVEIPVVADFAAKARAILDSSGKG